MLKLLFIPTGNIFTLPDEETFRIYNSDINNYKILEAGLLKKEEKTISREETAKIIEDVNKRAKEIEEADYLEEHPKLKPIKIPAWKKKLNPDILNIDKMKKKEIVAILHRLRQRADMKERLDVLKYRLKSTGVL